MRSVEIGITGGPDGMLSVSIDYQMDASALVKKWRADRAVVDGIAADIWQAVGEAFADPPDGADSPKQSESPGPSGSPDSSDLGDFDDVRRVIVERLQSLGLALYQGILEKEGDGLRTWGEAGEFDHPGYLIFKIDKALAYLPLEMMHDGEEFLAQRFAVGRVLYAEDARGGAPAPAAAADTVVLVGDPSEDGAIGEDVEREIDAVRDRLKRSGFGLKIAVGRDADLKYILANLPGSAIFHFSGHGVIGEDERATGLRLASGTILSGQSLQGLQAAPALAFLNVCTTASADTWRGSIGIVETLLARGTRACVATLWDVGSEAAATVPAGFYDSLLAGATFGEALRQARCAAAEAFGLHDPTWGSYVLYGDPRLTLPGAGLAAGVRQARRLTHSWMLLVSLLVALAAIVVIPRTTTRDADRDAGRQQGTEAEQGTEAGQGTEAEQGASPGAGASSDSSVAPAARVGYLVVESTPRDARITIDGKAAGLTPYALEVPVGSHSVRIEKEGYRAWEASVEVRQSPRANVKATLEKAR